MKFFKNRVPGDSSSAFPERAVPSGQRHRRSAQSPDVGDVLPAPRVRLGFRIASRTRRTEKKLKRPPAQSVTPLGGELLESFHSSTFRYYRVVSL